MEEDWKQKNAEDLRAHVKKSAWLSEMDKERYLSWAEEFEKKDITE